AYAGSRYRDTPSARLLSGGRAGGLCGCACTTLSCGFSRQGSPLDPLFAVFRDLFFPDGHGRLERIYRMAAGLERLGAMRAGDDDDDAALADLQPPDAMDDGDVIGLPTLLHLGGDGGHPLLGHLRVGVIFEVADTLAARVIAHDAL